MLLTCAQLLTIFWAHEDFRHITAVITYYSQRHRFTITVMKFERSDNALILRMRRNSRLLVLVEILTLLLYSPYLISCYTAIFRWIEKDSWRLFFRRTAGNMPHFYLRSIRFNTLKSMSHVLHVWVTLTTNIPTKFQVHKIVPYRDHFAVKTLWPWPLTFWPRRFGI